MGQLGAVMRACCAVAILCVDASHARGGTVLFDNGVTGEGLMQVLPEDYGTYGVLIGQQYDDEYNPVGVMSPFTPSYVTGPMLFITTNSTHTSNVLLSSYKAWADFLENPPPTPDGILADAMHTNLARTLTMPIMMTGMNESTSAFRVATDTAGGVWLDFVLVQRLTSDATAKTSQFEQLYTITNNGTAPVSIVFHVMWDMDLYYNGLNQEVDDIVGSGPGLCGAYAHDGDPRWSIALGSGPMSTIPLTYFYAGKEGIDPGGGPVFRPSNAAIGEQYIWINHGMPTSWQNYVVGAGKNVVGESPASTIADGIIGTEYRFSMVPGATETLHVRRYYGTITVPCFVSANCGNGKMDPGELCDGADTPTCNGATCTMNACGDGHMNSLAGEECDSEGVDSADCNGVTCTVPVCGDGHVNALAGEECEDGELCDLDTCTLSYSVGGGCAGCATGGSEASWLLGAGVLLLVLRRRR